MKYLIYKGYKVEYNQTGRWMARIWRPDSPLVMDTVTATIQEGESVLIKRAKDRIDEEESKPLPLK